ncbi:MAG: Mannuronate-specific alginate lyase [Bacteroidota bacterium]
MKRIHIALLCLALGACSKEVLTHKLTTDASPMNAGTVSPLTNSYEHGQQVTLTATPIGEYLFKEWKGSVTGSSNPANVVMDADKQVTGVFEKRQYPLTLTIEGNGTVKEEVIAVASQAQYPSGTTVKLTAKANPGATFSEWKGDKTGTDSVLTLTISKPIALTAKFLDRPMVPAVNTDIYPDFNFNDHVQGKNGPYDFNADGVPDMIAYKMRTDNTVTPAIVEIKDYTGKNIYSFNVKDVKPNVRDSLRTVMIDFRDLNNDGNLDLGLSYMAEWWNGQNGAPGSTVKYVGNFVYLLLSKGKLQYDAVEVLDEPKNPQISFNINLFDWDFDGKDDVLISDVGKGDYLKNMGNNRFERRKLAEKLFNQSLNNRLDFDRDGKEDFINLYINQLDENGRYTSSDMSQTLSVLSGKGLSHFPVVGKKIDKYIYILGDIISAERIAMADGDGDGDMDLIVGSIKAKPNSPWTYVQDYYENTGKQFEYRPNYIEIDESLIGELQVWSADVDKDGDMDLFYPTYRKSQLGRPRGNYFWWENTKKGFKINKNFYLKY